MIPYGRQEITQADIEAVVDVLKSNFITQGPVVPMFEQTVAAYCGAQYAVAANSATSALHIACLSLGLGPGDRLWTSPITFVASANCALYCGGLIDFVDIDPRTYNLSVDCLALKLADAERKGELPKIVIPVHLCGQSCDMAGIFALSQKYGFKIIEDASHAIGGKYQEGFVGNCRYSDITIFSFHPVKIITTGEGGMAMTNNPDLAESMRRYRSHGITNEAKQMVVRPHDEIWNYQQTCLGFNYRMTDIHAALGLSQMKRLDDYVNIRRSIAQYYDRELADLPLQTPWQHSDSYSSYHLYPIRLDARKTKQTQRQVYDAFHQEEILVNVHYIPVYRQPYYDMFKFKPGYCPNAEQYYKSTISLPMFPILSEKQKEQVITVLKRALQA